jgi:hypothetical protein
MIRPRMSFHTPSLSASQYAAQRLTLRRCNDRRPCDRCRATRPEACVDPADASHDADASAKLPGAAAARSREEEASALLWRSFASTVAATRAAGAGAGSDFSGTCFAPGFQATRTLAGIPPPGLLPQLDEDSDVLNWTVGTTAAAAATAKVPAQERASHYADYTAGVATSASAVGLSAAGGAPNANASLYTPLSDDANYRSGGGGGGAAWWTMGACALAQPTASGGSPADAKPASLATAATTTDAITVPPNQFWVAENRHLACLLQPQVQI